jgi:diketogulonate reductase-like aldo/keto reductase
VLPAIPYSTYTASLEKANVPRSELFITSKVNTQIEDIPATLKKQLSEVREVSSRSKGA